MERSCAKKNYLVCISVLAALNLGIVITAGFFPVSFLALDSLVQQVDAQGPPLTTDGNISYRFPNCTGGESVNCHTRGNHAGL